MGCNSKLQPQWKWVVTGHYNITILGYVIEGKPATVVEGKGIEVKPA